VCSTSRAIVVVSQKTVRSAAVSCRRKRTEHVGPSPSGNPGSNLHNHNCACCPFLEQESSKDTPIPMYIAPRCDCIATSQGLGVENRGPPCREQQIKAIATIPEGESFPLHWPLSRKHVLDFRHRQQSSEMTCQTFHCTSIAAD
jgi:hypothetical protein